MDDITPTIPQLPEDLTQDAVYSLKQVAAFIGSRGDPEVMKSFEKPPPLMMLVWMTVVLGFVLWALAEVGNYYEVTHNWSHYRCTPSIMPFAKFYGHNLEETFNFCIGESVKEHAPGVVAPIYTVINDVMGVVDEVYDKAEAIEGGVMGLFKGFESFLVNFANSFRLVGTRIRMSLVRIKDIFARIYGTFFAFAFAGISAITFGTNLIWNPLVVFLDDIGCFARETQVVLENGHTVSIGDIRIGDRLKGGAIVTSTYRFNGSDTPMVRIDGIHVSGNHYVFKARGAVCRADQHPAAIDASSLSRMYCLATSTHRIPVMTDKNTVLEFADYEESSDPATIATAQQTAEMALNGSYGLTVADYSLGLDPTLCVKTSNGAWKKLSHVRVNDELEGGARVFGVVKELCKDICVTPAGHYISAAQLVYTNRRGWVRAKHIYPAATDEPAVLYHLITSDNTAFTVGNIHEQLRVRDYVEFHTPGVQAPYDAAVLKS
jgi:hypothetical protein